MASCPNCGRDTARTTDWVCQWCAYPLPAGSFKKANKTFRELKEERESGILAKPEAEPKKAKPEPPRAVKAPPKARPAREVSPPPNPPSSRETTPPPTPQPAPAAKAPPPPPPPVEAKIEPPPHPVPPPQPAAAPPSPAQAAAEPARPAAPPAPPSQPAQPAIELTVADLLTLFEREGEAANAKLANRVLKVTGTVDKISVKQALDIYSVTLNSPKKSSLLQGVRCVFDRSQSAELTGLAAGQTLTVQGRFTGSMIDVSLRDCVIVR